MIIIAKKAFIFYHPKKTMQSLTCTEIEYTSLEDWHFYIKDYLADITNDKFAMLTTHQNFCSIILTIIEI